MRAILHGVDRTSQQRDFSTPRISVKFREVGVAWLKSLRTSPETGWSGCQHLDLILYIIYKIQ
jgi:hypothetical protein